MKRKDILTGFLLLVMLFSFTPSLLSQDAPNSLGPAPMVNNVITEESPVFTDLVGTTRGYATNSTGLTSATFFKFFLSTPGTISNVGTPAAYFWCGAIQTGANNLVYVIQQISPYSLHTIDTTTGAVVNLGAITGILPGHSSGGITGFTRDPISGTCYVASSSLSQSQLYSFDLATRVATPIGSPTAVAAGVIAIASAGGSIFAVDLVVDNLYKFNPGTGVATLVGPLGYNANYGQTAEFDPRDKVLYWAAIGQTQPSQLRTIDTTTGASVLIGIFTTTSQVTAFTPQAVGSAPPVSCNFVWSAQTSGVTTALSTVEAVDANVGWAAGANGVVRRTTDGGLTWTAASTTGQINGAIYCMDAIDANTAFVSSSPSATYIYKTSNGGANWTQVFTQAGGFIDGLQMINANTGYALGDPVGGVWALLITTNGGVNWTQMPSAPAQVGSEAGWNNSFQIEGTNMWFGTNNTRVYRSTNLGLNWTSGTTTGQLNSYGVHFNSATLGINTGTIVQKSTDGGATWTTTTGSVGGTGNMLGAEGYGADYFWVVRGTGIYYTSNGGTSWQTVPGITPAGTMNAIDFAIVNGCPTGWVVASNGNIYAMKIITGVSNNNNEIPSSYSLSQNYPNPFNPSTKISFALPKAGNVKLVVFDLLGREVATLVNDFQTAGNHTVDFNAANLSSGVYFYRIEAGDFTATNKMLLVK